MRIFLLIFVFLTAPMLVFSQLDSINARKTELEEQLKMLGEQIDADLATVKQLETQGTSLKRDINLINTKIASSKLSIKASTVAIEKLNIEIEQKSNNIYFLENEIKSTKFALADFLRKIHETDNLSPIELAIIYQDISSFFYELESLNKLQSSGHDLIIKFNSLKNNEESAREDLRGKKNEEIELRKIQESQKRKLDEEEIQKQQLLKITKSEEIKYQTLVTEKQKTASEIRKQIFHLFGGGELSFGEAYNLAHIAEISTGVRAAFILSILTQESAVNGVIGANVGKCYYNTPRDNASVTVMKNDQKQAFLSILDSLNLNRDTTPVSCPISLHGAYGGAMGPAQFMPNTWVLYKNDITKITGNNPPNPWRNADAFVATALFLENSLNSSSCKNYAKENQNVLPFQFLLERCTAAQYYAGGNWYKFRFAYGDPVVERADQFQRDINVLNGIAQR